LTNAGVADRRKEDVYLAVEKQQGLEFAMLKLTSTAFEQAAATEVIQWVLDKKLFRPFSLFIIACDMIFLILIIAMFSWSSSIYFLRRGVDETGTWYYYYGAWRAPYYNGKQIHRQMIICTTIIM
jgi:hypothetical protein